MKIDFARQNILIVVLQTLILLLLSLSEAHTTEVIDGSTIISRAIDDWFCGLPIWIQWLATILFIFICGASAVRIVSHNTMLKENTYQPALIFAAYSGYHLYSGSISVIITALMIFWFIQNLLDATSNTHSVGEVFNGSVYLGTAILLNNTALLYIAIWICGMLILRRNGKEWIASIVGILSPIAIYLYISLPFLNIELPTITADYNIFYLDPFDFDSFKNSLKSLYLADIINSTFIVVSILMTLLSINTFMRNKGTMYRNQQDALVFILISLLISLAWIALKSYNSTTITLLAIPLSIMLPVHFGYKHNSISNTIYLIFILSLICSLLLR